MSDHERTIEKYKETQAWTDIFNGWLKAILLIVGIAVLIFMYFNTATKLDETQRQLRQLRSEDRFFYTSNTADGFVTLTKIDKETGEVYRFSSAEGNWRLLSK